ncbi:hypothetical protein INT47_010414 [Mucor saturninus]|uniref:Uncharacterized protein n=1 Tax=Mucor saturninus TaxID=64648 RepID=A0A8H7UVM4_9FUNG|nr:hypothetical protein INT47_010414 [Mucor saturninus]
MERLAFQFEEYLNSNILQTSEETIFEDTFDVHLYAKFVKDGEFLSTKMTMIHCIILNYDISEVIKVNLNSYLRPIIKELSALHSKPLLVKRNGQQVAICRVATTYVSGDGVQCNELMTFGGHCSTYGCRFCLTKGKHRGDDAKELLRSKDSLLKIDDGEVYAYNDYSFNIPNVFVDLASFTCFFHASPKYNRHFKYCGVQPDYPFKLSNNPFTAMKKSMEGSRQLIPASCFKGCRLAMGPNNVKALYSFAEWMDWLLYCVSTLILSQFNGTVVIDGFLNLVRGITLSLQFRITEDDIKQIDKYVDSICTSLNFSN